ncbi:MAG: type II toxin-antitoxin system PemK/MazF family toxin [Pyrinomonadaceae bacterium]
MNEPRRSPRDKQGTRQKTTCINLTRTGAIRQLNALTVIPITRTIRDVRSQVLLDDSDGMDGTCVINVDNIQTVHKNAIGSYVTQLSEERMEAI